MDIRTEAQRDIALATESPVVALIVGTSLYPHADPETLPRHKRKLGVASLTSAARSASWFAGWLTDQWSERDSVAALHLLLAPAEGEEIDDRVADAWHASGATTSTLANFEQAFNAVQAATFDGAARAVIYLAGHGVSIGGRSATVLLYDYLDPAGNDNYHFAVDSTGCHESLSDGRYATTQFWFIDACREASTVERDYERLNRGWAPGDVAKTDVPVVAPLYLASSPWTSALAEKYGRSLFNQALEWTLAGKIGSLVPGSDDSWAVLAGDLNNHLGPKVKDLAAEHGDEQFVDATGRHGFAVVHQLAANPYRAAPATREPARPLAPLQIDADVQSYHLRGYTTFRVTTDSGELVADITGNQEIDVPVGHYDVAMLQPDGVWESRPVEVGGEGGEVRFVYEYPQTLGETDGEADTDRVQLVEVEEAQALATGAGTWTVTPNERVPPRVPRATFRVGERTMILSLPINPATTQFPLNAAVVDIKENGHPRAGFAPERTVSRTLQAALELERLGDATSLFEESSELLFGKYQDPVGAALGGLTLHRLGRLRDRANWVANLSRDFAWLPDGLALQAALLSASDDEGERTEGLNLVLEASRHRPMFYDGLALIVDLLQRWPDKAEPEKRLEHLGFSGPLLNKAVHSSVVLLTDHGEWG